MGAPTLQIKQTIEEVEMINTTEYGMQSRSRFSNYFKTKIPCCGFLLISKCTSTKVRQVFPSFGTTVFDRELYLLLPCDIQCDQFLQIT